MNSISDSDLRGRLLSMCECDEAPMSFAKDKKLKCDTKSTERAPHS